MYFYRAHITADDMERIAHDINHASCPLGGWKTCLSRGYSENAGDYELVYGGVIAETTIAGEDENPNGAFDASATDWTPNNPYRNQIKFGVKLHGVGFYRGVPTLTASAKNVALSSNGGIAYASSFKDPTNFPIAAINNNERAGVNWTHGGGWADGTPDVYPDWVRIDFPGPKFINQVNLFTVQDNAATPVEPTDTMTFTTWGITDFSVCVWDGNDWVLVGSVSGNNLVKRPIYFSGYSTTSILITVNGSLNHISRITEVEAWGQDEPDATFP